MKQKEKHLFIDCIELAKQINGHEKIMFDTPIVVRPSGFHWEYAIIGLWIGPNESMYITDDGEEWYIVETSESILPYIIHDMYNRLLTIKRTTELANKN